MASCGAYELEPVQQSSSLEAHPASAEVVVPGNKGLATPPSSFNWLSWFFVSYDLH